MELNRAQQLVSESSGIGMMASIRSRGTTAIFLIISMIDSNACLKIARPPFEPSTIGKLQAYEPFYQHVISPKNEVFGRVLLLSLRIEGQASLLDDFSLESRNPKSGSVSGSMGFKTLGQKMTTPADTPPMVASILIDQVPLPVPTPALALVDQLEVKPSLLGISLLGKHKGKQLMGDLSLRRPKQSVGMAASAPKFSTSELGKQVMVDNSAKNHDTSLALVLQRAEAILERMKQQLGKLKKTKIKMGSLESELNKAKLTMAATDHLKADLAYAEQARDDSYVAANLDHNETVIAIAQRDEALQELTELWAVACGLVYKRVFNKGID
ncbi:hypothetical protein Acr_27g0001590 [Actinidia rufa]|uniref:Uncharacterized protein n=1 Tax=Actinidia rufa TaxID=165716 RepID=A0A7J0H5Q1_9ERIC|nr:hypothetical protein Acr_27g0001590 [Actinidia rufa]